MDECNNNILKPVNISIKPKNLDFIGNPLTNIGGHKQLNNREENKAKNFSSSIIKNIKVNTVFYESPKRLISTLEIINEINVS